MTLQALAQRQRDLMQQEQGVMQQPAGTIAQGLGVLGQSLVNALQQRAIYGQMEQGRQAVSDAFSQMNPQTGELPPAALSAVMANSPEMGLPIYEQAMAARQAAARQAESERAASALSAQGASQQEAAAVAAEQRRLAEPQTPRARVLADFQSGKYGDPSTTEAQAARDAAIRASEAPQLSLADRQYVETQQNEYAQSDATIGSLNRASALLKQGISSGTYYDWAAEKAGRAFGIGDAEFRARTDEYNGLMAPGGDMATTLSKVATPAEIQQFLGFMNDPTKEQGAKQQLLDRMAAKVQAYKGMVADRIHSVNPNMPLPSSQPSGQTPAEEEQSLANARAAIAKNPAQAATIRRMLQAAGIDPGRL
jgi:hypothetical protein